MWTERVFAVHKKPTSQTHQIPLHTTTLAQMALGQVGWRSCKFILDSVCVIQTNSLSQKALDFLFKILLQHFLVSGKFGPVWSRAILPDRRPDSPVPDKIFGTKTGTATDCLYQSGPGPDPVPAYLAPLGLLWWPTGGRWCTMCVIMSRCVSGQCRYSQDALRSMWGMGEANGGP